MRKETSTNFLNERALLAACPFARALGILAPRWSAALLFKLAGAGAPRSFGELRGELPGVSKKVLAARLRELASSGVLAKRVHASDPPRIEYALTARGRDLVPAPRAMEAWGRGSDRTWAG